MPTAYKYAELEARTEAFARNVRAFLTKIQRTSVNKDDITQLLRSSGSVGANYIEANEAIGRKDFVLRIRICRKEAKESMYWLRLLPIPSEEKAKRTELASEARQLTLIFAAILRKCTKDQKG